MESKDIIAIHFGKSVRKARKMHRMSQSVLAKKLNVGIDTISHYERYKCKPSMEMICKLSDALNVDVGYFFPQRKYSGFNKDEEEMLAFLTSLSPSARQYVFSFIRYFIESQSRRRFLTEEVLTIPDSQERLLMFLERDLHCFEQSLVKNSPSSCAPIHGLVAFSTILLMGMELERVDSKAETFIQRISFSSRRLSHLVREAIDNESAGIK